MLLRYIGFKLQARGRDYSYQAVGPKDETREFVLTISNHAFLARQIPYQDGADICYQKLRKELDAETPELRLKPHLTISDQELDAYRQKYRPTKRRG
jgi:hypothetical protein